MSPSNVALFITNLRLLDLDRLPDWPDITPQTFYNKDASSKNRIRAAEWALFRLFELWDPEETRNKLQPFFPPFEPLQSVNLRAALFRCLNEAKKNGVVGKEMMLRKTMLDECKGDKFYELLAIFSTAVLKKSLVSLSHKKTRKSIVRRLVTASTLTNSEQASLLPLTIAHKAALGNALEKRKGAKTQYATFSRFLDEKTAEIKQRNEDCAAALEKLRGSQTQSSTDATVIRQIKESWTASPQWLDAILKGNPSLDTDLLWEKSFPEVWEMVQTGSFMEKSTGKPGLLQELEARVRLQQSRLRRWKTFHEKISQENKEHAGETPSSRDVVAGQANNNFMAHEQYRVAPVKRTAATDKAQGDMKTVNTSPYFDILDAMRQELMDASKPVKRTIVVRETQTEAESKIPKKPVPSMINYPSKTSISKVDREDVDYETSPSVHEHPKAFGMDRSPAQSPSQPQPSEFDEAAVIVVQNHAKYSEPNGLNHEHPIPSKSLDMDHIPSLTITQPTNIQSSDEKDALESLLDDYVDEEEELADRIISSVSEASPSPVKRKPYLSLTERTRMSIAHNLTDIVLPAVEPEPSQLSPTPGDEELTQDHTLSLEERTRQSMLSSAAKASRAKLRRSMTQKHRQSLYPVNQFENTSKAPYSILEEKEVASGRLTPKEELFSEEAGYESVFKSRPKIALSPVMSPTRDTFGHIDVEAQPDDDETSDLWEISSPLVDKYARQAKKGPTAH